MKKMIPCIKSDRLHFSWLKLLTLCFLLVGFNRCYFDVIVTEDVDETEEVGFNDDIIPIFQRSCASCHDGEITVPDLTKSAAYESLANGNYISVVSPSTSGLISKINTSHPFEGALTDSEIQQIIQWMGNGAANN